MSARIKLTDEQIDFVRDIVARRRAVRVQLEKIPTLEDLAETLGCTKRYLEKVASNHARVPRETTATPSIEELAASLR